MKRVWYYAKAQSVLNWLAVGGILAGLLALLLGDVFRADGLPRRPEDSYLILQVFLPLALGLLLADLPVLERNAGAAELCLTCRQPAWARLLEQVLLVAVLWAGLVAAAGAVIGGGYAAGMPLPEFAEAVGPPALALGGAALAGSSIARSQVGGILAAGAWWSLDLMAPGTNPVAYLFSVYRPLPGLSAAAADLRMAVAGLLGIALALLLSERRSRWIG